MMLSTTTPSNNGTEERGYTQEEYYYYVFARACGHTTEEIEAYFDTLAEKGGDIKRPTPRPWPAPPTWIRCGDRH